MKAVIVTEFGDAKKLQIVDDWAQPQLAADEVLLKVRCASINPIDWKTRKGLGWAAESIKNKLPWVLGFDVAGEVISVGKDVDSFKVGSRVCTTTDMLNSGGSYAELIAVSASRLVAIPENVDFKDAAALPLAGMTGWQSLDLIGIEQNDQILILGGAGGVGHLCCQFARLRGAHVSATTSTKNKVFLQSLGVHPIDYNAETLEEKSFDGIIDLIGGNTGINALSALKDGGKMVTIPSITAKEIIEVAETHGKNADTMIYQLDVVLLEKMLVLLSEKKVKVEIQKTYALHEITPAHQICEEGHVRGKIVITVAE